MEKTSQKSKIWKIQIVLILLLGITIGTTLAYFTAYATENGKKEIVLGAKTEIREEIKDLDKSIKIFNEGPAEAFVRVKVFYPQFSDERLKVEIIANDGWKLTDEGWYEYERPLKANETTSTDLYVTVEMSEDFDQDFNIVVVHESVQPLYEGDVPYPNWNLGKAQQEGED